MLDSSNGGTWGCCAGPGVRVDSRGVGASYCFVDMGVNGVCGNLADNA